MADGRMTISGGAIEQRKQALLHQLQNWNQRLMDIERQMQGLQRERDQVVANLNAVSGALQLCDELLKGGPAVGETVTLDGQGMTLDQDKPDED